MKHENMGDELRTQAHKTIRFDTNVALLCSDAIRASILLDANRDWYMNVMMAFNEITDIKMGDSVSIKIEAWDKLKKSLQKKISDFEVGEYERHFNLGSKNERV